MRSERHSQRDLFDERATVPLLQILLTEAADIGPQDAATRAGAQEDGDDQDHA